MAISPGDYTVLPVQFSYFDVSSQSYKTISTDPLTVHVDKGTGHPSDVLNILKAEKKEQDNFYDRLYNNRWLISVGLFFVIAVVIFFTRRSPSKKPIDVRDVLATPEVPQAEQPEFVIPTNPLAEAEEKLSENNSYEFYHTLDIALKKYLSLKLDVPVEELTKKKINESLDKCNVGIGTTLILNSLLEDIELNLYAPASSVNQMQDVYEKANEFVGLLQKQVC